MTDSRDAYKIIAHIHTPFATKFGVPRQSGLADVKAEIVFEPEYARPDAVRGLEQFSHIWLLWKFSEVPEQETFRATVRPPRLGGDTRVGVFATRSPFRPNPIGLSSVKLEFIEYDPVKGPVLHVTGADLMDGTPILDIKPYLPYVDSHPEAAGGYTDETRKHVLQVVLEDAVFEAAFGKSAESALAGAEKCERCIGKKPVKQNGMRSRVSKQELIEVLSLDPRPSYQEEPDRIYGMEYAGHDVRFRVEDGVLYVTEIV